MQSQELIFVGLTISLTCLIGILTALRQVAQTMNSGIEPQVFRSQGNPTDSSSSLPLSILNKKSLDYKSAVKPAHDHLKS